MAEGTEPRGLRGYPAGQFDGPGGSTFAGDPTESQMQVLRALDGVTNPIGPYAVSLAADRLVTVDELMDMASGGFVALFRRESLGPEEMVAATLTAAGRLLVEARA